MYRINYIETDPNDETTLINAQTREFDGPEAEKEALFFVRELMTYPMFRAQGKPGIIITRLQDEQE